MAGGGDLTNFSVRGFIRLGQLFEGRLIWEESLMEEGTAYLRGGTRA
jgi:hypothetical protein